MEEAKVPVVPQLLRVSQVHNYVRAHHHFDVTRQTAYNWVTVGVFDEKLKTVRKGKGLFTTKGWVDAFLARVPRS